MLALEDQQTLEAGINTSHEYWVLLGPVRMPTAYLQLSVKQGWLHRANQSGYGSHHTTVTRSELTSSIACL